MKKPRKKAIQKNTKRTADKGTKSYPDSGRLKKTETGYGKRDRRNGSPSLLEIYNMFIQLLTAGKGALSLVGGCVLLICSAINWIKGNKLIACIAAGFFIGLLAGIAVYKWQRQLIVAFLVGFCICILVDIVGLAAMGQIIIRNRGDEDMDMQQNETMPTQGEQDMQAVDSTESPISSYDEKSFEDEIKSPVWKQMLKEVGSEGVTGTKQNFQILKIKVETVLAVHTVTRTKSTETNASKTVQKNVDTIKELEVPNKGWQNYTEISKLRYKNYEIFPILENARQVGISSLDCLYYMGKVNGKEDKDINEEIYNRENLLLYGYRSIDGFADWMYLSKRMSGNQAGLSGWYELGQIFHHLGDADNLTSDKLAIEHLAISAVCYSEVAPNDSELYKKGNATDEQYNACFNLAIVFDKLDNYLKPEDLYLLEEAKKYYEYAYSCSGFETKKKENIQSYSDIVEQKMKNRKK